MLEEQGCALKNSGQNQEGLGQVIAEACPALKPWESSAGMWLVFFAVGGESSAPLWDALCVP